jgi:hypothetical protein
MIISSVTIGTVQAIFFKGVGKVCPTFYIFHTIKYDVGDVHEAVLSGIEVRESLQATVKIIIY